MLMVIERIKTILENFCLEDFKTFSEALQSLTTTIAIVIGGLWTYLLFVKQRQRFPRLSLSHNIFSVILNNRKSLIHIEIKIVNQGSVIVKLDEADIKIYKITPLGSKFKSFLNQQNLPDLLEQNLDPSSYRKVNNLYELIGHNNSLLSKSDKIELEPGEEDKVYCDFIVSSHTKVIELYSYFKNINKKKIGWGLTTIHDLETTYI